MRDLANKMRRQKPQKQQRGQQADSGPKGQSRRMNKEALKQLAESLKRAGKSQRRRRLARMGKMRLAALKEMLRQRQGRGQQGRKELDRLARGKRGKRGKKGQSMSMGQGQGRKGVEWMRLNKVLQKERNVRMGRARLGDGAGHGKNRMLQGRSTDLKGARTKKDYVRGQKTKGPSRKEILLGAAEEGTRVRGYGKVHIDYSTKAAQQMKNESVPPGYREYVEQYFRLIRQR